MVSGYMINADAGTVPNTKANVTYANPNDTVVAPLCYDRDPSGVQYC